MWLEQSLEAPKSGYIPPNTDVTSVLLQQALPAYHEQLTKFPSGDEYLAPSTETYK